MHDRKASLDGQVNSPDQRKPKKPKEHAARSIEASKRLSSGQAGQELNSKWRIYGVTGRRGGH